MTDFIIDFGLFNGDYNWRLSHYLTADIISELPLSSKQIEYFDSIGKINWTILSGKELSRATIEKYKHKIDWDIFFTNGKKKEILALYAIRDILNGYSHLFFEDKYKRLYYNKEFMVTFPQYIDWNWCAVNKVLDEYVIGKYWDKFNISLLSKHQAFSQKLTEEKKYSIRWQLVRYGYDKLDEEFLMSMIHLLKWEAVLKHKQFSEKNITRLIQHDKSLIDPISRYQNLSLDYIMTNLTILNLDELFHNLHYNKPDSIQICKAGDRWFILDAPIMLHYASVNFVDEASVIRI
jgi:hypothetical protein